jgi:hypothetical protein
MRFENNSVGVKGLRLSIALSPSFVTYSGCPYRQLGLVSYRLEYNSQVLPTYWTLHSIQ